MLCTEYRSVHVCTARRKALKDRHIALPSPNVLLCLPLSLTKTAL
ncbi:unnamed protein product [Chondrus crispus]|uniref:Uncharacterized protein n=1 Tax=Chondrus crispus TaxID=2769 RepID=R7QBD5_CHOCR|nr:unnamed protein product [Chondrus crispus]CDF35073.1 unnamed protein product [Chondrus crispus]|eukprot:XP_005714892.1 unnamed protein product [Chondrus crispus]